MSTPSTVGNVAAIVITKEDAAGPDTRFIAIKPTRTVRLAHPGDQTYVRINPKRTVTAICIGGPTHHHTRRPQFSVVSCCFVANPLPNHVPIGLTMIEVEPSTLTGPEITDPILVVGNQGFSTEIALDAWLLTRGAQQSAGHRTKDHGQV
jgi:hypothetical protein